MRPFAYDRADSLAQASRLGMQSGQGQAEAAVQFLAGGTTLIDLMKLDVLRPTRVVDLGFLRRSHSTIAAGPTGLTIGAFATMSAVADHPDVAAWYPVITDTLRQAASAQLRNMATIGGNLLQRTRCNYFRDPTWSACNKRTPDSGCAAIDGFNRNHAILGVNGSCIAQYPGDLGVALVALDARLDLSGPQGARNLAFADLHRPVEQGPQLENTLRAGEIITAIHVPPGAWTRRSVYVKVRDRASYEFAIASAAVALDMQGDTVQEVRIGLGGVAYRPWRSREAETLLTHQRLDEASAQAAGHAALQGAVSHGHNDYKSELSRRTLVRALLQAKAMS